MDMMRRLRRKNEGFKLKSRKSSVMRFIRVVKRRHFMSYDVMADEMLRSIFVPFDPQKAGSFLDEDIIIMCNKEKVRCLSGVKYILMDGKFKVAPPGFMQMYTIMAGLVKGSTSRCSMC